MKTLIQAIRRACTVPSLPAPSGRTAQPRNYADVPGRQS